MARRAVALGQLAFLFWIDPPAVEPPAVPETPTRHAGEKASRPRVPGGEGRRARRPESRRDGGPDPAGRPKSVEPPLRSRILLALVNATETTPLLADILAVVGVGHDEARKPLAQLARFDEAEVWDEPPHGRRIMLGAKAIRRFGVELSPSGRRWVPKGAG